MKYKKALVIQTAFLGDVILMTSLLEKLHRHDPDIKISILVKKGMRSLFESHPYVEEILEMDKTDVSLSGLWKWILFIRRKKYDLVINAHRYFRTGLISSLSGARHIAGYKENPFSFLFNYTARFRIGDGTHEVERLSSLISDFAGEKWYLPRLYPSSVHEEEIRKYRSGSYVCFAPGSVWRTKQLPEEKWVELGKREGRTNKIFFIGSREDTDLCERICKELSTHRIDTEILCGKISLLGTVALMKGAGMNYVNDSAPLHMASAVNAPVTAFFCSTVPEFGFYPLSDQKRVVEVRGLSCRPCGIHGKNKCPEGHFRCGYDIQIDHL